MRALAVALAAALLLAGCARMLGIEEAPEYIDQLDFAFTQGVPAEQPLPPLRTAGLGADELNTVQVYRARHRGVVNVTSLSVFRTRFGGAFPEGGTGSGFIIDQRGTVVTNHHVVGRGQRLIVTLWDGSNYPARVVGSDPELDLAVLRFDPQGRELTTIPQGDSDTLQVGQEVLALGNPFGLEGTLTTGVVSALNRPVPTPSGFLLRDLIQVDAAINPGNSGGPLLDSRGELIGVNTMILSPTGGSVGLGFAVPANAVHRIVGQILETGRVTRGWIDVQGVALDPRLAGAANLGVRRGILVTRVLDDGNAAEAGVQDGQGGRTVRYGTHRIPVEGDVIVAIDGEAVASVAELLASLEATRPGDEVVLIVVRDGERRSVPLVLGQRPG